MSPVLDIVTITKSDTSVLPTSIGIDDLKRLTTMTAKKATTITKKMKEPNTEQTEIKNSLIIIETTITITVTKRHQTITKIKVLWGSSNILRRALRDSYLPTTVTQLPLSLSYYSEQ